MVDGRGYGDRKFISSAFNIKRYGLKGKDTGNENYLCTVRSMEAETKEEGEGYGPISY